MVQIATKNRKRHSFKCCSNFNEHTRCSSCCPDLEICIWKKDYLSCYSLFEKYTLFVPMKASFVSENRHVTGKLMLANDSRVWITLDTQGTVEKQTKTVTKRIA